MRTEIVNYRMMLETRVGPACLREAGVGSGFQGYKMALLNKDSLCLWTQEIAREEMQHVIL